MKRGLIGLQLSLGRPSTKHLLNPSQGLTGTLLGISTFDNGIFYYNSLMETPVQRTFLPFLSIDHELYKDGSWRSRRNALPALGCSRFFSSCVFLHCHSAVPSAVKRWKKQLTEEHPQGNTSSAMLARRLFSKHLLGFILLQLGQPAAKGHIQSLLMCCGRQVRPVCSRPATSPSSSRFSMCRFSPIHFRMNVAFGLFSRGSSLHS